jgi:hypothetical protein
VQVGDMVRVTSIFSTPLGGDVAGIITALKGRSSFSNDVEVYWVLVNGRLSAYGSYQLMKVAQ